MRFVVRPPNVPLQPRRLTIAPAAVGCKPRLGWVGYFTNTQRCQFCQQSFL
jgi:hypothetical protein